jgi:hypothetical protein
MQTEYILIRNNTLEDWFSEKMKTIETYL